MTNYNGVVTDLTSKFASLRTEELPKADSEIYGISDDFKSLFSIFKLKLTVDPEALLTLNPSDELDSVPKLCPECNGPLFLLFRKPKLCPCCKKSVLCDSCFQKHQVTVEIQTDNDIKSIATQACAECIKHITVLQDRARITRTIRAGTAKDEIAFIYPEIARLIEMGERRLARFRDLCDVIHDSGAPEVSEVNGVVDQIKLCRGQVQGYVGKLRELKFPPRSSRQRMQDNLSIYAFDWLNNTRAEFTALSERLRVALQKKPAADPSAPQIDTVIPMIAPLMGASPLLIRGRNLPPGTQVLIQDSLCRVVSRVEKVGCEYGDQVFTEITVLSVPSKKEGVATVSVVAPNGKSASLEGFCYVRNELFTESDVKSIIAEQAKNSSTAAAAPKKASSLATADSGKGGIFIQQVNPSSLPIKGGEVTIRAQGIKEGVTVEINSKVITPKSVSVKTGEIIVKAPKCKVGSYSLKVMNPDGGSAQLDGILFYSSTIKEQYNKKRGLHHHKKIKSIISRGKIMKKKDGDDDSSSSSSSFSSSDFDNFESDDEEYESFSGSDDEGKESENKTREYNGFVLVGCEKPKTLPPMPPSMVSQMQQNQSSSLSSSSSTSPSPSVKVVTSTNSNATSNNNSNTSSTKTDSQPQRRVWGKPTH